MTIRDQFTFYFGSFKHWRTMDAQKILNKIAQCETDQVGAHAVGNRVQEALNEMELAKETCKIALSKCKTPYQILEFKNQL